MFTFCRVTSRGDQPACRLIDRPWLGCEAIVSVEHTSDSPEEAALNRRLRMHGVFMQDLIADGSLADLLPDQPEYLDFFERGTPTGRTPDFQTPKVDVYVIPDYELHPNHRRALQEEFPRRRIHERETPTAGS